MHIARQRGICKASNAFNVARFVSNVFLDAARGHRQRCFSIRTALYATAAYTLKDESRQRIGQDRYVPDKNNVSALPFNPIKARAASKRLARQNIDVKLQASLDPTSLEKTLENHRAVNMGALIECIPVDRNVRDFHRPTLIAKKVRRRKGTTMLSEKSNADKEKLEKRFEEHQLLRDDWFEHLDISTVPKASKTAAMDGKQTSKENKADKIIKSKAYRAKIGTVLGYEGKYVNPISSAKLDDIQLPWAVAVDEAATAIER
jgi:hypothetical protein